MASVVYRNFFSTETAGLNLTESDSTQSGFTFSAKLRKFDDGFTPVYQRLVAAIDGGSAIFQSFLNDCLQKGYTAQDLVDLYNSRNGVNLSVSDANEFFLTRGSEISSPWFKYLYPSASQIDFFYNQAGVDKTQLQQQIVSSYTQYQKSPTLSNATALMSLVAASALNTTSIDAVFGLSSGTANSIFRAIQNNFAKNSPEFNLIENILASNGQARSLKFVDATAGGSTPVSVTNTSSVNTSGLVLQTNASANLSTFGMLNDKGGFGIYEVTKQTDGDFKTYLSDFESGESRTQRDVLLIDKGKLLKSADPGLYFSFVYALEGNAAFGLSVNGTKESLGLYINTDTGVFRSYNFNSLSTSAAIPGQKFESLYFTNDAAYITAEYTQRNGTRDLGIIKLTSSGQVLATTYLDTNNADTTFASSPQFATPTYLLTSVENKVGGITLLNQTNSTTLQIYDFDSILNLRSAETLSFRISGLEGPGTRIDKLNKQDIYVVNNPFDVDDFSKFYLFDRASGTVKQYQLKNNMGTSLQVSSISIDSANRLIVEAVQITNNPKSEVKLFVFDNLSGGAASVAAQVNTSSSLFVDGARLFPYAGSSNANQLEFSTAGVISGTSSTIYTSGYIDLSRIGVETKPGEFDLQPYTAGAQLTVTTLAASAASVSIQNIQGVSSNTGVVDLVGVTEGIFPFQSYAFSSGSFYYI